MQEIDLGSENLIKVKWKGNEYTLREPTVRELDAFQKEASDDPAKVYDFLELLGMPKSVTLDLPASKAKKLIDGLLGVITEKK